MMAMRKLAVACAVSMFACGPALANEPVDPVKVLMDMAAYNAGVEPDGKAVYDDYFSAGMLLNYFSDGFVDAYVTALLAHKKSRDTMLLDHDPVFGGQDGCVPKDVTYGMPITSNGVTELSVSFKRDWCYDGEYAGKDEVTQVVYRLVQENDEIGERRYVVDDIRFVDRTPLRAELRALAQ